MSKEYETGYGKPPKSSRFKPGQSGNRKGRPKGSKNTYNLLNEILSQKITIKENDENIKISKKAAILTQLINKGVKGDVKAIATLLPHILMADIKEEEKEAVLASLNQDDKAIIEMYMSNFDGAKEADDDDSY